MSATHLTQISNARLVVIDGFVPVPRGAVAAPPVMPSWPVKDPGDVLDYTIDLSAATSGDPGDAVTGLAVTISPNATGDLALQSSGFDGTLVTLWLAAGNAGTVYTVTVTASFASGRGIARSIALPVYSLSGAAQTPVALVTDTGQELTDQNGNPIVIGT